ncbi:MAG: protein kinase domain-containing protein [Kofleriaceae bacterium]
MTSSAVGGIRFGQYALLRRIARGGMAEVFLAQQRGLEGFDRRVAVKRILPHLADAPDFVKMFLGEAKLAAQLTHPNVVHIYDFGKHDGDYFIAMEYVEGVHAGQLFKYCAETEKLPPVLVARLGADAAAALHYAHELRGSDGKPLGLVHRDVSPANIMVSFDGIVKLCDFGIAKAAALGEQLTNPGQVKGKYAYMSPEQTIASPLDGRSDVFSLAIVMWELLAGKTIVGRGDAVDAMRAIRDGKLPLITNAAPKTPPALAKALGWAMATRRENRATAMDFAQALEAYIKSSPEIATSMQLASWIRQRFPRDQPSTGQHAAIPGVSVGTRASPGTLQGSTETPRDSGTAVSEGTSAAPDTPAHELIAASRVTGADILEGADTIAVLDGEPDEKATLISDGDHDDENDVERITIDERNLVRPVQMQPVAPAPRTKMPDPRTRSPSQATSPRSTPDPARARTTSAAPDLRSAADPFPRSPTDPGARRPPDPRVRSTSEAPDPRATPDRARSSAAPGSDARGTANDPRPKSPIDPNPRRPGLQGPRAGIVEPRRTLPEPNRARTASSAPSASTPSTGIAKPGPSSEATLLKPQTFDPQSPSAEMTAAREPIRGTPSTEMTAMSTPVPSHTTTDRDREAATRDRMRAQTGPDPDTARDQHGVGLAALTEVTRRGATPMPAPPTETKPQPLGGPAWLARASQWFASLPPSLRGRNATLIGALAGVAVLSFIVALAAKSCGRSAPARTDASVVQGDTVVLGDGTNTNDADIGANGAGTGGAGAGTIGEDGTNTNGSSAGTNANDAGVDTNGGGVGADTDGGQFLDPHIDLEPPDAGAPDAAREPTIRPDAGAPPTSVLEVRTQPTGGVVTVKGIDEVRIDPARFALEPGHYEVNAEFPGYLPEKREVVMERGLDVVQEIAFTRKKPGKQPPQTGKLTARTVPYSAVYMNGKLLGETPFAERALPIGTYTLTFKNPDKGTVTRKIKITANKTTKVNFTFP